MPALACCVLLLAGAATPATTTQPDWFVVGNWTQLNGLPHSHVSTILQTRDGYVWVGTAGGLARFDGVNFTVFDDRDPSQLGDSSVGALAEDPEGSLWIGTLGGGLSRYQRGRFKVFGPADGLPDKIINKLAVDPQGRLWLGSDAGLMVREGGRFRRVAFGDGRPGVKSLYADPRGDVWVGPERGGLRRLVGGRDVEEIAIPGLTRSLTGIAGDWQRGLWLSSYDGLFSLGQGTAVRHLGTEQGLSTIRLISVHQAPDGILWIGSADGLHRMQDGGITRLGQAVPKAAGMMISDREGGLWLASDSTLKYLRQGQFVSYGPEQGLSYYYATTLLQDREGSLWIATGNGLNRLRGNSFTVIHTAEGLPRQLMGALSEDSEGHLWVGTDGGLYRSLLPLGQPQPLAPPRFARVENQPADLKPRVITRTGDGSLWIGDVTAGLWRYRQGVFTDYTRRPGLLHGAVHSIVEDRDGALWFGTRLGLNRLKDDRFSGYTTADGLPHETVEALHLDDEGVLWVATRRGVSRFAGGRFTSLTVKDGLPTSFVQGFADDREGNLWFASGKGVFRARRSQLAELAAGRRRSVPITTYGVEHGLIGTQPSGGYHRNVLRTGDGRIWFALTRGISAVDPRRLAATGPPPVVHLEQLQVDGRPHALPETAAALRLPPGRGDLTFGYTGISFRAPEKVQFRYRLVGHDQDWVQADRRRLAQYSNLPPGHYTFQVIAASGEGVWDQRGAQLQLVLQPHWYQRLSTRLLGLLALVAAGLGAHRRRVRILARRQQQLEQKVGERTAALAAINRELEAFSYSASHDLRAPLRSMTGFSQVLLERHADRLDPEGRDLLERVAQGSRRMQQLIDDLLTLSRAGGSELQRRPVDLSALARATLAELQARAPERRVDVVVAPGLVADGDPDLLRIALENLLGNAWKFTGKHASARIEVGQRAGDGDAGAPVYFVRDDGAGFDPAYAGKLFRPFQRLHGAAEFEGTGVGLSTVRRIVERHGGRLWAEGAVEQGATFYFTLGG